MSYMSLHMACSVKFVEKNYRGVICRHGGLASMSSMFETGERASMAVLAAARPNSAHRR
jgi:hypothetical protein